MMRAEIEPGGGPVLSAAEVRTLVSVGFYGVLNGQAAEALRLFEALLLLRPQEGFPHVGKSLALIASGRADEAVRLLERHAQVAPANDDSIQVFLGLALRLARREHHAQAVLRAVADGAGDSHAQRLARELLDHPV